jgi:polyhydroxyalkanoate synthesis regulator phasin
MTRIALLAAVVATSLIPLSAFAKGGGGGHAGGGSAGGGSAGGHPAAQAGAHPHSAGHHSGASSHQGKPSAKTSNASSSTASRPGNHAGPSGSQFAKDHPRRNEVNHRDREQLARVAEGLKSGKLTPTQAKQILSNDRSIKQQEHADVKANGGFLTKSQQRQINQEENANSRLIHNDTHPASPATAVPVSASRPGNPIGAPGSRFAEQHPRRDEVNSRVGDQRARIAEGVKSGKLTPTEAKQLLSNDKAIKQQEHAEVKANGGFLTKSQQRQLNHEESADSRLIRKDESASSP